MVVPAAPGGVSDVMARLLAQRFTTAWNQQVIVENRGGANHAIGAAMVGKAARDGHSMMVAAETVFVINPTLHAGKLPYDVKDFAPVTGLVRINQGLLANPSLPAGNIAELIALAKRKPGEITYGSSGIGAAGHVNVRAAREHGRHQARAGALSRCDAGPQRRAGRPHHADLGQSQRVGAALSRRQGQDARRREPEAQRPDPGGAGNGRDRAGLRGGHLVRPVHHRRHTAGGDRPDQRRGPQAVRRDGYSATASSSRTCSSRWSSSPEQFAAFIKADGEKWSKVLREANIRID